MDQVEDPLPDSDFEGGKHTPVSIFSLEAQVSSETLGEFCDSILQRLEAAGIRVKYDDRINYTAGWK